MNHHNVKNTQFKNLHYGCQSIYNLKSLNFLHHTNLKIGILGGSFNPAHAGHLHISLRALNYYKFDYVIWLIANQNPFKKTYQRDMTQRSHIAKIISDHPRILISSAEKDLELNHSYDVITALITRYPNIKFSWLMGIDNISSFHKWYRFEEIMQLIDIIVFDRPSENRLTNNTVFHLKYKTMLDKKLAQNIIFDKSVLHYASSSNINR